jgi:hypothetical protein
MKFFNLLLLATAFGAGALSQAQESSPTGPEPAPPEAKLLGSNYRIAITATTNGKAAGEVSVLTCSSAIQMDGILSMPTEANRHGAELIMRGWLAEQEGGALKLSYSIGLTKSFPNQVLARTGDSEPVSTSISVKKFGSTGMLLLQSGKSYVILKITDVVYSISIIPVPLK